VIEPLKTLVPFATVLVTALVTLLDVLYTQRMTALREHHARQSEQEAVREQGRNQFQVKTLLRIQHVASDLVERAIMQKLEGWGGEEMGAESNLQKNEIWKLLNRVAPLRERVKDDELRGLLGKLVSTTGFYLSPNTDNTLSWHEVNIVLSNVHLRLGIVLHDLL
jgi:hypothetical protein